MKFFNANLISIPLFRYSAHHDDVQDILEPSLPLYSLYSMPHILSPKNVAPNISSPILETPVVKAVRSCPLVVSPIHSRSSMVDIPHVYAHGLYSQPPSVSLRLQHYIFESLNHGTFFEHLLAIRDTCILSPIQCAPSTSLQNVNSSYMYPFRKFTKFIETKVTAIKLQGFNLFLGY
jgi:hypothetical protein